MELVNDRFEQSAMVLPHRPYALLTGEFRRSNHSAYLGNTFEAWDPEKVLKEAKLVHFSDWPLPKPWIMWPAEGLAETERRKDICRLLSVPAPDWHSIKGVARPNATDGTRNEAPQVQSQADVGSESSTAGGQQSAARDASDI
ncbi:uncharacterized protein N0V89_009652 [Didymosphaeria variabile]|uniref:Uncharacterized protein n=1 Tax=Didymosphaeria variabile TaxID=1932322 RepID=A0A9W8XE53_9PLEO|nr:uncharacterized protein N0V89_009652 [Didymosphaeria variabile]KAJ4348280.1 hypothetical protein N0V89_009652 [Didymosphaeria variabile]